MICMEMFVNGVLMCMIRIRYALKRTPKDQYLKENASCAAAVYLKEPNYVLRLHVTMDLPHMPIPIAASASLAPHNHMNIWFCKLIGISKICTIVCCIAELGCS